MTDKELIKQEIERIIEEETPISKGSDYYHGVKESMEKLRQFINSLPEESGCEVNCTIKSGDLKEELDNFLKDPVFGKLISRNAGLVLARHFAEWQKQKDEELFSKDSWNYIEEHYPNVSQEEKLRLYDMSIKSRLAGADTMKKRMKKKLCKQSMRKVDLI